MAVAPPLIELLTLDLVFALARQIGLLFPFCKKELINKRSKILILIFKKCSSKFTRQKFYDFASAFNFIDKNTFLVSLKPKRGLAGDFLWSN